MIPQNPFRLLKTKNTISLSENTYNRNKINNRIKRYSNQATKKLVLFAENKHFRWSRVNSYCRNLVRPKQLTKFTTNLINNDLANFAIFRMSNLQQIDILFKNNFTDKVLLNLFKRLSRLPKLQCINIYLNNNHELDSSYVYQCLHKINWQRYSLTPEGKWIKQAIHINLSATVLSVFDNEYKLINQIGNLNGLRIFSVATTNTNNFLYKLLCLPYSIKYFSLHDRN